MPPSALLHEWAKTIKNKLNIKSNFFGTASVVPDPRELNSDDKNLMIFDDLLLERQNKSECYYIRGRHSNVDCFYLSQNYFKLPRQTIRENANFICLFSQDLKNINHIYSDHVGEDMTKEEFRKFCCKCWDSQNYFKLPRQTIRENANFICLFSQDLKNINHIYSDHVGEDMTKEEFRKFCCKCWEKPHGFAVINLTSKKDAGKYRDGFDNFFIS